MYPMRLHFSLAFCFFASVASYRIVDLSHEMKEGLSRWPNQRPYEMNVTFNGTTENGYWYQSEYVCAGTHFATHLDAPCHFNRGAWCVSDIPINRLVNRPAVCLHLQDSIGQDAEYQLDTGDLHIWEDTHGRIPDGAVVLVNTGWSRFWDNESKYRGTSDPSPRNHHFPGVSSNAAEWLAAQRHVFGVGIDTLSIDYGQTKSFESHVLLGRRNVFVLENLCNLDKLPAKGFIVNAMALPFSKASGAPARVVAVVNSGEAIMLRGTTIFSVAFASVAVWFVGRKIFAAL